MLSGYRSAVAGGDARGDCRSPAQPPCLQLKPSNFYSKAIERFVAGKPEHPNQTPERRAEVAKGQHPFAVGARML